MAMMSEQKHLHLLRDFHQHRQRCRRPSVIEIHQQIVRNEGQRMTALRKGRDALLVQYDFLLSTERRRVAAFAAQLRLPAIYENRMQTLAGGLMSYGGDLRENYRQGASYVHRVLNGTS